MKRKISSKKRGLILDETIQKYLKKDFKLIEKEEATAILKSQKEKKIDKGFMSSYSIGTYLVVGAVILVVGCAALGVIFPLVELIVGIIIIPIALVMFFIGVTIWLITVITGFPAMIFTKDKKIKIIIDDYGEVNIIKLRK